jgi:hypothetical protein
VTDLKVVFDRQILFGTTFSHDVLQYSRARGVRGIII